MQNVTYLGEKNVKVGFNQERLAKFYSIKPEKSTDVNVNHHILLVDVSGSMYSNLPELKVKLNETLDALTIGGNNYVSVILYSSHGECFRILNAVKCDTISYKMAKAKEVIEKELYTRSLTVISEPLKIAIETSEGLADIANKHNIVLFTDGCVVPRLWSGKEEESKCYDLAKLCKEKNYFLNAIGFGNYYDREFLKTLTSLANGTVNHIDEIPQYYNAVLQLIEKVDKEVIVEVKINNKNFFLVKDAKEFNGPTTITSLKEGEPNLIVVFDEPIIIENEEYSDLPKEINSDNLNELLYALSLNHILNDDIDSAELTMAQTGDILLFSQLNNCYSFSEKGKVINLLNTALVDTNERFKGGKKDINVLSAEEEPICLLEILQEIINCDSCKLYWDLKANYKRIGQKTRSVEDNIKFIYPENRYVALNSITIAKDKLNVNVKATIKGSVLNTTTTTKMDASIFRDYSLIKNGMINVDKIAAKLTPELKDKFKEFISQEINYNGEDLVVLNLLKIKTTNKRMLKLVDATTLAQYLYSVKILGVQQWAINQHIKNLLLKENIEKIDLADLSEEVINARKEFRINEKGIYSPLEVEKDETSMFELYQATMLEWKIEKFPKTKIEKEELTKYEKLIDLSDIKGSYEKLNLELLKVQDKKRKREALINMIRISSGLINKPIFIWENQTTKSKKTMDTTFNMNMVVDGIVKISTKSYDLLDKINVREDRYNLLLKAN